MKSQTITTQTDDGCRHLHISGLNSSNRDNIRIEESMSSKSSIGGGFSYPNFEELDEDQLDADLSFMANNNLIVSFEVFINFGTAPIRSQF